MITIRKDNTMNKEKVLPILAAMVFSLIFGFSFMFSKVVLQVMNPIEMISFRFMLAAITLYILKLVGAIKIDFKGKSIKVLLLVSLAEPVVYFIFESLGLNLTSSSEAGLMISLIPVITAVLGVVILKESIKPIQVIFIIMSVGGVVFINLMKEGIKLSGNFLGIIFLTIAVFSSGFYNIGTKKASESFTPIEVTYVMLWVGAIVFNLMNTVMHLANGTIRDYFLPMMNLQAIIPIVYLGILSSIVAFFMVNYSISKMPVTQFSVFGNLVTLVSIFAGVFILNEDFFWYHIVGTVVILLGVWGTVYFGAKQTMPKWIERLEGRGDL